MSRTRLLSACALGAALVLGPARADAWCRTTTDQTIVAPTNCVTTGAPLYWSRRCQQFNTDIASGAAISLPTFRAVVTASFDTWNAVTCGGVPVMMVTPGLDVTCDLAEYRTDDGNSNTVTFINDFFQRDYPTDAVAVTIVWHNTSTGQIYDADMLINEAMAPFAVCPDAGCPMGATGFDLQNVVTHEAGHFLGLAHSADVAATMYYRTQPLELSKRTLAPDDIDGLCDAYGGTTVPAECDPTPRHGFDSDCTVEPAAKSNGGCGCTVGSEPEAPTAGLLALGLAALARTARRRRR